jgi:hypothetical protein
VPIVRVAPIRTEALQRGPRTSVNAACDKSGVTLSGRRIGVARLKLAWPIVLHRHERIVIMNACELSSRLRVAMTACAVLLTPGIVG